MRVTWSPTSRQASTPVDVVIVTHNNHRTIGLCIESVRKHVPDAKVIVIDSGSEDGSEEAALCAGADVVHKVQNLGFGVACNIGASCGSAPWILFLNPDAVLVSFNSAITQSTDDVLVPVLISHDGTERFNTFCFPTLVRDIMAEFLIGDRRQCPVVMQNSWVSGACFLIRRSAYLSVGGFDPDFFLYREDTDLCLRLRHAGYRFAPAEFTFSHLGGESTQANPGARSLARMHSRLVYAAKHYGPVGYSLVRLAILVGVLLKLPAALAVRSKNPVLYARALGLLVHGWAAPPGETKREWISAMTALKRR